MAEDDDGESDEEDVPMLVNPSLTNLSSVLDEADVVVKVLDCRDPMSFRSLHVEELVKEKGKKVMFVLNKIGTPILVSTINLYIDKNLDAVPQEAASSWLTLLRKDHPHTYLFRSASLFLPSNDASVKGKGKESCNDALGAEPILGCLTTWASEKADGENLAVAVVGLTNVSFAPLLTFYNT
jgi:nuclear GTP-binding protein